MEWEGEEEEEEERSEMGEWRKHVGSRGRRWSLDVMKRGRRCETDQDLILMVCQSRRRGRTWWETLEDFYVVSLFSSLWGFVTSREGKSEDKWLQADTEWKFKFNLLSSLYPFHQRTSHHSSPKSTEGEGKKKSTVMY